MIVNHPSDLADGLAREHWGKASREETDALAEQVYQAGLKAGWAPSLDWSAYLAQWRANKWEDPGSKSAQAQALNEKERAELAELRRLAGGPADQTPGPGADSGGR